MCCWRRCSENLTAIKTDKKNPRFVSQKKAIDLNVRVHLAPPPVRLYWILSLRLCAASVPRRLSQAWRSLQKAGVRDCGRKGDMVLTSIIHTAIARETGCKGIQVRPMRKMSLCNIMQMNQTRALPSIYKAFLL